MTSPRRSRVVLAPAPVWVAGGVALALAVILLAAALVLARDTSGAADGERLVRAESPAFFAATIGVIGLLLLVAAIGMGGRGLVGPAVALLLACWVVALAGAGPVVRVDYAVGGAGHLVVAEMAFWSIERRVATGPPAGRLLVVRCLELMALLLATIAGGWAMVSVVAGIRGGVALDVLAVLAVVGFAAAVGLSARRAA